MISLRFSKLEGQRVFFILSHVRSRQMHLRLCATSFGLAGTRLGSFKRFPSPTRCWLCWNRKSREKHVHASFRSDHRGWCCAVFTGRSVLSSCYRTCFQERRLKAALLVGFRCFWHCWKSAGLCEFIIFNANLLYSNGLPLLFMSDAVCSFFVDGVS